jgi:hypothetical protein
VPILFRKAMRFGPLVLNFTPKGLSSWGLKIGKWSWNSKTRAHRYDLPGPFSWRSRGRRGGS